MSEAAVDINVLPEDLTVSEIETSTMRAVSIRILPFLILAYFLCVLDRVNVSFAALTMTLLP